jgi:hypothetical protein
LSKMRGMGVKGSFILKFHEFRYLFYDQEAEKTVLVQQKNNGLEYTHFL